MRWSVVSGQWLAASSFVRLSMRKDQIAPRFQIGQLVRARNINPVTHTRLPRYVQLSARAAVRKEVPFTLPRTFVARNHEATPG